MSDLVVKIWEWLWGIASMVIGRLVAFHEQRFAGLAGASTPLQLVDASNVHSDLLAAVAKAQILAARPAMLPARRMQLPAAIILHVK